jgi:Zn-dependent metalloprotease
MKKLSIFLLAVLLGVFSFSEAQIRPDSVQLAAFSNFDKKLNNNVGVNWNDKTGTPGIVVLTKPYSFAAEPVASAKLFLKEMKGLLRKEDSKDELVLMRTNEDESIQYLRFDQFYKNIPVRGGEYLITVLPGGEVQSALGKFHKNISVVTTPELSEKEAFISAIDNPPKAVGLRDSLSASRLIIYPQDSLYFLAWELKIPTSRDGEEWMYIIDASNGAVLSRLSTAINEISPAMLPQSQANIYLRHPYIDTDYTYISPINDDASGYLQGTYANVVNDETSRAYSSTLDFTYSTGDTHFDEANLFYHIDKFRRDYWNGIGFTAFTQITAHAHTYFSSPNAEYSLSDNQLRFSDGQGVTGFNSFAREDKVIYHEYTHAVTDYIAHLYNTDYDGYNETFAIHEGNSDYYAAAFTGRTLALEYCCYGYPEYQRDISSPRIATYSEYTGPDWGYPAVEPHDGGELWSRVLWDLRQSGTGIGSYYADRVIYKGLNGLPTTCTFLQYRQSIINADINYYSGNHAQTIRHIFYLRGIGPDYLQTRVSGPSALDFKERGTYTANVTGGSGSVTYQWYRSDDGGSTWRSLGTSQTQVSTMVYDDFIMRCEVHDTQTAEDASGSCTVYYGYPPEKKNSAQNELTDEYKLYQNYPNPFNPATEIKYKIKNNGFISLKIYDPLGKEIAVLVKGFQNAGEYTVNFDAGSLPSGIYFYKIETAAFREVKKMMLLR